MLRMLRVLAAISFVWMVGFFLLRFAPVGLGVPFNRRYETISFLSTLGGELAFAVGILALAVAMSRRQIAWSALFASLLVLLQILPPLILYARTIAQNFAYPNFLDLFAAPPGVFGRYSWAALLPALIPGVAFIYAAKVLAAEQSDRVFADVTRTPLRS